MHRRITKALLTNAIVLNGPGHFCLRYAGLNYPKKDQLDSEQIDADDGIEKTPEPLDLSKLDADNESAYYPVEIENQQVMEKAEDVHDSPDRTETPPPPLENEIDITEQVQSDETTDKEPEQATQAEAVTEEASSPVEAVTEEVTTDETEKETQQITQAEAETEEASNTVDVVVEEVNTADVKQEETTNIVETEKQVHLEAAEPVPAVECETTEISDNKSETSDGADKSGSSEQVADSIVEGEPQWKTADDESHQSVELVEVDKATESNEVIDYSQFDNFECVTSSQENDKSSDFGSNNDQMACASFTNTSLDLSTLDDQILSARPAQVPFSENSSTTTETSSMSDLPSGDDLEHEQGDSRENIDDVLAHLQQQHVGFETIVEESNEDISIDETKSVDPAEETVQEEQGETPNRGDFNIPAAFKEIPFKPLQSKDAIVKVDDGHIEEKKIVLDPKNISIFEANKPTPIKSAAESPEQRVPSSSPESNVEVESECQPIPSTDTSLEEPKEIQPTDTSQDIVKLDVEMDTLNPMSGLNKSPSMATLESVDVTSSGEMSTTCSHELLSESELKRLSCDVDEMAPERTIETINTSKTIEVIQETIVTEIKRTGIVITPPFSKAALFLPC